MKRILTFLFLLSMIEHSHAATVGKAEFIFDPGYLGAPGHTESMDIDSAHLSANDLDSTLFITYEYDEPSSPNMWSLSLTNPKYPNPAPPGVGCYEHAHRDTFTPARPGLDFSFGSTGCNMLIGRYRISELLINQSTKKIEKLSADFVQQCEGKPPAVFGKIRINSDIPIENESLQRPYITNGQMSIISTGNDPVGRGDNYSFDLNERNFRAWSNYSVDSPPQNEIELEYSPNPTDPLWELNFIDRTGSPVAIGAYPDVRDFNWGDPAYPGLGLTFDHMMCGSTMRGDLAIFDKRTDQVDGYLTALSASFSQQCDPLFTPLFGYVTYSTVFINGPLVDDVIFLDGMDSYKSWPLKWDCH